MAKVYTGKIALRGDKFIEYLKKLDEVRKAREPLRLYFTELNEACYEYLSDKYSESAARDAYDIVAVFIKFIINQTDVEKIEEITRGMVNSHFRRWYNRKVPYSKTPDELRGALKEFFLFLKTEKNIENTKVWKAFD